MIDTPFDNNLSDREDDQSEEAFGLSRSKRIIVGALYGVRDRTAAGRSRGLIF